MYTLFALLFSLTFAAQADDGIGIDPNGLRVKALEGNGLDPHGGVRASIYRRAHGDEGAGLDPFGRR